MPQRPTICLLLAVAAFGCGKLEGGTTAIPPEDWCEQAPQGRVHCDNRYSPEERCDPNCTPVDGGVCLTPDTYPHYEQYCGAVRACALDCVTNCHEDPDGDFCHQVRAAGGWKPPSSDAGEPEPDAHAPDGGVHEAGMDATTTDGSAHEAGMGDGGSDANSPSRECEAHDDCTDPAAASCAADGQCAPCARDAECMHLGLVCDQGLCVACRADDDCPAERPACDSSGDAPVCVACLADGDCTDPAAPKCDTRGAEPACVACLADTDCTDPGAAKCDAAGPEPACVACDDSSQCDGIEGLPHCHHSGGCVECIGGEEGDAQCGMNWTCTDTLKCVQGAPESIPDCGQCQDDRQCENEGRACIAVDQSDDEPLPLGQCLPVRTGDECVTRAYLREVEEHDVRGVEHDACRPAVATCDEMLRFDQDCAGFEDDDFCVPTGLSHRWTVACNTADDCPIGTMICEPIGQGDTARCETP